MMSNPEPSVQTANIWVNPRDARDIAVSFYRNGDKIMHLPFRWQTDAERAAEAWRTGAKQWEIAELIKAMSMKP